MNTDSGAPNADPTSEARADQQTGLSDRKAAATAFAGITVEKDETLQGFRAFVAPAKYGNTKILVNPESANFIGVKGSVQSRVVTAAPQAGSPLGLVPAVARTDDNWAKFTQGVLVTDDPDVIAWCESHPSMCRDADDPRTRAWVTLKDMQSQTPSRDATLDSDFDVDAEIFPDGINLKPSKTSEIQGDGIVDAALATRDSANARR